jgi:hypothetical protein
MELQVQIKKRAVDLDHNQFLTIIRTTFLVGFEYLSMLPLKYIEAND